MPIFTTHSEFLRACEKLAGRPNRAEAVIRKTLGKQVLAELRETMKPSRIQPLGPDDECWSVLIIPTIKGDVVEVETAEKYWISTNGTIRAVNAKARNGFGSELRLTGNGLGRPVVNIQLDNGRGQRQLQISRLMAATFLSLPEPGKTLVLHRDDDPWNFSLGNLRWGNDAENAADKIRNGNSNRGEASPNSKLTKSQVEKIRAEPRNASDLRALARKLGQPEGRVNYVYCDKRVWPEVPFHAGAANQTGGA